jgi:Mg2+/Co2+ transporter CorC
MFTVDIPETLEEIDENIKVAFLSTLSSIDNDADYCRGFLQAKTLLLQIL